MRKNKNQFLQPNEISESTKASLATRIVTGLIGAAVVLPCMFIGDYLFFAFVVLFTSLASHEIITTTKGKSHPIIIALVWFFTLFFTLAPLFKYLLSGPDFSYFRIYDAFGEIVVPYSGVAVGAVLILVLVIFNSNIELKDGAMAFLMVIIVSLGMQSLLFLRYIPAKLYHVANPHADYWNIYCNFQSSTLLIYVAIAAFFTDIGAYFVGVFFGKHKMNPRISPKKTWEGFFGGIIFSFICSFSFAFFLCLGGFPVLQGVFDVDHWYLIVIFSLVVPFVSVLGDLAFSAIKRVYNVKDYGQILPGHGGVLDRIDSLLVSAVFSSAFIMISLAIIGGANPII